MNLKMQMRPRRAAGVADVGNDLPGFDLLACGDADARAVRVPVSYTHLTLPTN